MEDHVELIVFGLLLGTAALAVLARVLRVPYPITLVVGGVAIGYLPGVPDVELDPDIVLLIFLPPLLYGAAFFTSLRDLRRNARPIALLSIGVVFATMGAVAVVAHEVIGLGWAESFVLGAIVSPTDAVAPAEILRRTNAPRRLLTVVEGENLTNDWTALVLYRFAVAAVATAAVSVEAETEEVALSFLLVAAGGVAVGYGVGRAAAWAIGRLEDTLLETLLSFLAAFASYLAAEWLHLSGVTAVVA
ncbi:MAG: cation:proton antiporter, partial [Thermoleophilia bacterium]